MRRLMQFAGDPTEPAWVAVKDGVMGGLSVGSAAVVDGQLHFSGMLSLANNGGFSSVRARGACYDLGQAIEMVLRVCGDGRDYQLRLATDASVDGKPVSYGATFSTQAGQWQIVHVGLDTLTPSLRGTPLGGPPFEPSSVREIGLLIADRREGPFRLAVDWIGVE